MCRSAGPAWLVRHEISTSKSRVVDSSDEALFRDYTSGDEQAFVRLLERYKNRVACLVRCRLGPSSLWAEDVAQDVFVEVHRSAQTFQERSSFKTWLYAIAVNVCRDHLRRQGMIADRQARDAEAEGSLATLPDESLDPLQRFEHDERSALVHAAIERLTPTLRIVLQLRDGEDMNYNEISHVLAVPVGTVRSRLHNARAALAKELLGCLER
jgi:RNA polymerase sigma-70 factor, ECF subfamily